ncbi:Cytochrome c4 (plasmid) [Pseudomonas extremaustralis]|uniref:C-type cytochrome n=1 Tax=Pseudomonas cremoris TaxID=2724178 RepID=A0ABR6TDW7_9PSED|nr:MULTISPECIES: c-type cytochrome [Pseudomonas]MBC2383900.1 c-type cytochrome [Pseudomonas cremoris]MDY7069573.1 Cytochrome c4 [Pseudomonas extremaustralis]
MKLRISVGVLLLAATLAAHAQAPAQAGTCVACHGSAGQGNPALGAPRLAGQQAEYLMTQLQNFKAARRGYDASDSHGAQMRAVASGLSDSDIQPLAQYFSRLAFSADKAVAPAADPQGQALYQGTCASCHGPQGEGYAHLKTPNLKILDSAYIERQLTHFVQGVRGAEGHADELGIWMRGISLQLAGENERKTIAHYIGSLKSAGN